MKRVSLALSGGGHRATVFSLGALLYLVDSGRHRSVRTITSVSGGSLTNAYLALLEKPFSELSPDEFRQVAYRFANQIAGSRVTLLVAMFASPLPWVVWLVALPAADSLGGFGIRLTAFVILTGLWSLAAARCRGTIFGWWGTWFYLAMLVALGVASVDAWEWHHHATWGLVAAVACALGLSQRHLVASLAYGASIRGARASAGTRLSDLPNSRVRHIFCATELHVGRHIFFSPEFVYCERYGLGLPGRIRLSDAVQLSANFPGGFPFRLIRSSVCFDATTLPSRFLTITDGGVYDNTGTAWYRESVIAFDIKQRLQREQFVRRAHEEQRGLKISLSKVPVATSESLIQELEDLDYELITINAAYPPMQSGATLIAFPIVSDLLAFGFATCTNTLYNNGNLQRLRGLRSLSMNQRRAGAVISIEEHPEAVAAFLSDPERWSHAVRSSHHTEPARRAADLGQGEPGGQPSLDFEEMVSFFESMEYGHDGTVSEALRLRAKAALRHLYANLDSDDGALSTEERKQVEELQFELDARERVLEEVRVACADLRARLAEMQGGEGRDLDMAQLELARRELDASNADVAASEIRGKLGHLLTSVNLRRISAVLEKSPTRFKLDWLRKENKNISTTLFPLGGPATARLLYQGYIAAMMNLHVLNDYPLLGLPELDHFQELVLSAARD